MNTLLIVLGSVLAQSAVAQDLEDPRIINFENSYSDQFGDHKVEGQINITAGDDQLLEEAKLAVGSYLILDRSTKKLRMAKLPDLAEGIRATDIVGIHLFDPTHTRWRLARDRADSQAKGVTEIEHRLAVNRLLQEEDMAARNEQIEAIKNYFSLIRKTSPLTRSKVFSSQRAWLGYRATTSGAFFSKAGKHPFEPEVTGLVGMYDSLYLGYPAFLGDKNSKIDELRSVINSEIQSLRSSHAALKDLVLAEKSLGSLACTGANDPGSNGFHFTTDAKDTNLRLGTLPPHDVVQEFFNRLSVPTGRTDLVAESETSEDPTVMALIKVLRKEPNSGSRSSARALDLQSEILSVFSRLGSKLKETRAHFEKQSPVDEFVLKRLDLARRFLTETQIMAQENLNLYLDLAARVEVKASCNESRPRTAPSVADRTVRSDAPVGSRPSHSPDREDKSTSSGQAK